MRCLIVVSSILLFQASYSAAQAGAATDIQVETAYLYNFGKFVTFPADRVSADSFQICIIGKDPLGAVLDSTVRGETINGRRVTARRLANMDQSAGCSILFVSSSEEGHLSAILNIAERMNLLTVSDVKGFANRGGIIGLVRQQDRIRFEVNLAAAQQSHLVLSSELLKIALRVLQNGQKEEPNG